MPIIGSNHALIFLAHNNRTHGKSGFLRFDTQWLLDPTSFDIVNNVFICFSKGSYAYQINQEKLTYLDEPQNIGEENTKNTLDLQNATAIGSHLQLMRDPFK